MISIQEALTKVISEVKNIGTEAISISSSLGRILAQDIISNTDIPGFDNSAMDGFAVISSDVEGASSASPIDLTIIEDVRAGQVGSQSLSQGQAVRIMTGAVMPKGADSVVMVENAKVEGATVSIGESMRKNENVRFRGESVRTGDLVMEKGERISPAHIGMLASLGIPEVTVYQKPRVAILATGDELVECHEDVHPGQIRTSNSYSLSAQIETYGGIPVDKGIARDDKQDLSAKLKDCLECDIILTSGGVSMGDYDFVKEVLEDDLGVDIKFWKVAMKPGKPILFGTLKNKLFFGLAGNPVSSMVNAHVFVKPAILKMQGSSQIHEQLFDAVLGDDLKKDDERETLIRANTKWRDGQYVSAPTGAQGSGILQSMVKANSLIIFPRGENKIIPKGEKVKVRFL